MVGYVRAVTLSWLFSAPITAFRLPIEETIAQGAMATVVITAAALYTAFGKWFGFVGLILITLLALLYSALKNYVFRRIEPRKPIDLPERHKRFLSDWGGQSIRLIDLFMSFLKVQFVCLLPIIIGMLSALVFYNYAMQVETKNQDRFVVSVPNATISFSATLIGEDDDRLYVVCQQALRVIEKSTLRQVKKANLKPALEMLKTMQHTGLIPQSTSN